MAVFRNQHFVIGLFALGFGVLCCAVLCCAVSKLWSVSHVNCC